MPKVSVIIPTYNLCDLLRSTIDSVLAQTLEELELIVVDDGSTDGTRDVVQSIEDRRVKYLHKDNGGTPAARNYGLARAEGEFVAFLDHDDLWPSNYLEVMIGELEKKPEFGLGYSFFTIRYSDGREIISYKAGEAKSGWLTLEMFKNGFVLTSASVIRRSVLEGLGYDETLRQSYEDGDFLLRLSMRTPFLYVSGVEAIRRDHGENLSVKVGTLPIRILVLERFYYRLGGKKFIPFITGRKRLSHTCRKVARSCLHDGKRTAAVYLYRIAIKYWPFDVRLYGALVRSFMLDKSCDSDPQWQMPEMLPEPLFTE